MSKTSKYSKHFISFLVIIGITLICYYVCIPEKEIVFPSQSQSGLVKNELISDQLSRLIKQREKIKDISAISAVLVGTGVYNDYDIEFTLNDGKKIVGHSYIAASKTDNGIPEAFRADRLTNDYLEFMVFTDGKEYGVVPDVLYFLRFYDLIETAYENVMHTDPEMIKAQWQKGIDNVNSTRLEKSERLKAE
jgi:hypothetical protein